MEIIEIINNLKEIIEKTQKMMIFQIHFCLLKMKLKKMKLILR